MAPRCCRNGFLTPRGARIGIFGVKPCVFEESPPVFTIPVTHRRDVLGDRDLAVGQRIGGGCGQRHSGGERRDGRCAVDLDLRVHLGLRAQENWAWCTTKIADPVCYQPVVPIQVTIPKYYENRYFVDMLDIVVITIRFINTRALIRVHNQ